jgi:hypothetical protein
VGLPAPHVPYCSERPVARQAASLACAGMVTNLFVQHERPPKAARAARRAPCDDQHDVGHHDAPTSPLPSGFGHAAIGRHVPDENCSVSAVSSRRAELAADSSAMTEKVSTAPSPGRRCRTRHGEGWSFCTASVDVSVATERKMP